MRPGQRQRGARHLQPGAMAEMRSRMTTFIVTGIAAIAIAGAGLVMGLATSHPQPRPGSARSAAPPDLLNATERRDRPDPTDSSAQTVRAGYVAVSRLRKGYRFAATLTARNAMIFRGKAPDAATRESFLNTISELAPSPDTHGTIALDPAVPDPHWPALVEQALGALALMHTGTLAIRDQNVTLDGTVDDERDLRRLMIRVRPDWVVNVDAPAPTLLTSLAIEIAQGGHATARGRLPPGVSVEEMRATLPEVQTDDGVVGSRLHGDPQGWSGALAAVATALPRFSEGSILIGDGLIDMRGRLRRGFSRQSTHAALRAMAPAGWRLSYDVQETPPPSQATLELTTEGVYLRGLLPAGTDLPELRRVVDARQVEFGGDGDPERWATAVAAAARLLELMSDGRVRIASGVIEIAGRLLPGQTLAELDRWLERATENSWKIDLGDVEMTKPTEGTVRVDPETGTRQKLHGGRWAAVELEPSTVSECVTAAQAIEAERGIRFLAGSRRVAPTAAKALDRLAALARRCLAASPSAQLEIGGHTDSVGSASQNQALSEARARAIRAALVERGAAAERLIARGYGEDQPVADNATEAGRARNRRISLRWQNLEGRESAGRVATTAETALAE